MNYTDETGRSFDIDPLIYNLIRMRAMLNIEVETGMKYSRGSVMNAIRDYAYQDKAGNVVYITHKRTKKGVLADLDKFLAAVKAGTLN